MKFFVLRNCDIGNTDAVTEFVAIEESLVGETPRCNLCGNAIGMLPLLPPIRLTLEAWGVRWGDIAFGAGNQILVSGSLKRLFIGAGLVGFTRFASVEAVKMKARKRTVGPPPTYELASIQRSRAAIDDAASGLERDAPRTCEECRIAGVVKRTRRIILEPNTWSGEDIFFARGLPGCILVSERFYRLCVDNGLANCCFVEAEKLTFDFYPQERPTLH